MVGGKVKFLPRNLAIMPKRVEITATDDLVSPKKRKRISSSSSSSQAVTAPIKMPAKVVDPYEAAVTFEQKESTVRTTEEDMKLFHNTCHTIRKVMGQIEDLKKFPDANRAQIAELRALAGLHVLQLKKINRLEKLRLKAAREATHGAKQRVDTFHLTLQNLLYEIVHVRREINRCLEFRSQDEDISLVAEEDFYRDAPEEISQPAATRSDSHRRHLARLDWELEQRRRLAADCEQQEKDKKAIGGRIGTQRRRLDDLAPQLSTILKSTRPLQEELSLPLDQQREQHRLAALLPKPLYVLYVQTSAYAEACDADMSATICGNEEEATSLKQADQRETAEESDSDPEPDEEAHHKKRHRKASRSEENPRVKKLLQRHPLLVVVEIVTKDLGKLVLEFAHLTQLGIIAVSVAIRDCPNTGPLLSADSLLDHLTSGDSGAEAPSAAASHRLRRAGLPPLGHFVSSGQLGKPYQWAQRLGGLEFVTVETEQEPPTAREEVSALQVETAVRQIRARFRARVALQSQLTALGSGDLSTPEALQAWFPARRDSRLLSWNAISSEQYRAAGLPTAELLDDSCSCYLAKIGRGNGPQLACYVALSPRHPQVAPLVGLQLTLGKRQLTARHPSLRTLEHDLNVALASRLGAGGRGSLLPALLLSAASALDVLSETADTAQQTAARRQPMLRPHRGRDRVAPFRYDSTLQLYTHGTC